jgi:hypothetical protein
MTFEEYERFIRGHFTQELLEAFKEPVQIYHQREFVSKTGATFNIDLSYTFRIGQIDYLTIVECKNWKTRVGRNIVMELKSKIDELKAHKGILVSSNGFESGSIEYALSYGIGLIKVTSSGLVQVLSHYDGNFGPYMRILYQEHEIPAETVPDLALGIISTKESLESYLLRKYEVDIRNFLEHDNLDLNEISSARLKDLPLNWYEEYEIKETCGLRLILDNEGLIRIVNMWVALSKTQAE